jgi:hypothetical protein
MAFLGAEVPLSQMTKQRIQAFLDTKVRSPEQDSEKKWITTWNDYMLRIKHFYRWLHNAQGLEEPKPDFATQKCGLMEDEARDPGLIDMILI